MSVHIIKASLLNVVGRVVSILSTFISIFLLGRMFGASEFGYWTWLFSIFSLITAQDFGFIGAMRVRIGRSISEGNPVDEKLFFAVSLTMALIFSGIVVALGGAFSLDHSLDGLDILLVLSCGLITVIGYCASQGSVAYLQSGLIGVAESLRGFLQIAAIGFSSLLGLDFKATLLLFYAVSMSYTPFVMFVFLRSREWTLIHLVSTIKINLHKSLLMAITLLKDGAYLWLTQIGLAILSLSDVFIAGLLVSDDDVAVVNAIIRLILVAVGFVMAAMTPITGHFVLKQFDIDLRFVWKRFAIAAGMLLLIGIVYGIFLYYFGPMIIEKWANLTVTASYVFLVAGLLFSFMGIVILLQTFLQIQTLAKAMLPSLLIAGILKLTLPILIVPIFGYEGVFLSGLIVNAGFVAIAVFLLFKCRFLKRILLVTHG